jgi:hypothetical protein
MMQTPPANTLGYMIAGYTVVLGAIGLFLASLVIRFRRLVNELKMLDDLKRR